MGEGRAAAGGEAWGVAGAEVLGVEGAGELAGVAVSLVVGSVLSSAMVGEERSGRSIEGTWKRDWVTKGVEGVLQALNGLVSERKRSLKPRAWLERRLCAQDKTLGQVGSRIRCWVSPARNHRAKLSTVPNSISVLFAKYLQLDAYQAHVYKYLPQLKLCVKKRLVFGKDGSRSMVHIFLLSSQAREDRIGLQSFSIPLQRPWK